MRIRAKVKAAFQQECKSVRMALSKSKHRKTRQDMVNAASRLEKEGVKILDKMWFFAFFRWRRKFIKKCKLFIPERTYEHKAHNIVCYMMIDVTKVVKVISNGKR